MASLELRRESSSVCLVPGAGKSVLARLIAGLEDRDDGEIFFNERIVHAPPPDEGRVGMVFPDFALWTGMSVAENVAYPLKVRGWKRPEARSGLARRSRSCGSTASRAAPRATLACPGPSRRTGAGGCHRAELLILDEPLEQFDSRGREAVWEEIRRLCGELGVTTLLLTRVVADARRQRIGGGHGSGPNSPDGPTA